MRRFLPACILLILLTAAIQAQVNGDVLGMHNLSVSGTSPIKGGLEPCEFCHAPHSGVQNSNPALWSQTLSVQTYSTYASTTEKNTQQQPTLGQVSSLCLSCHDGTVAVGQTQPYGEITMTGSMNKKDKFGANLQGSHPFSLKLPMVDAPDLLPSLTSSHTTGDPAVKLVANNVECTSCHTPHAQAIDKISQNFLVRDSSSGHLCVACHEVEARTVGAQSNPLAPWSPSIHATANNRIADPAVIGTYLTVAQNACLSCHMPHNSLAGSRLLRGPDPPISNMDSATQNCILCHNGGSNISPAIPNIYAEFAKNGHPFPAGNNTHDAAEAPLLNNNRHSTCVDCHNGHTSLAVTSFSSPLPPVLRGSQKGAVGISASDGNTTVNPAVNQYETCLRCHGTSSGKQSLAAFGYLPRWAVSAGDPLNIIPQFSTTATSSHPVLHDRNNNLAQLSLRSFMFNLDGTTQGRAMGVRILCTDCHNSDDNREFGGTGPNGPHGSQFTHILERRYEFSQVSPGPGGGPGTAIQNLFPNPILSPGGKGPYNLCAKCHDLNLIVANTSFTEHRRHIEDGFTCSTCHTSHGVGAMSAAISGERLVNFDINVVAPNGSSPISYNRATNSCSLTCHNHVHKSR